MGGIYYCPHGYARGVCGVCTDPGHECREPKLKKQVAKLRLQRDASQALVRRLQTELRACSASFKHRENGWCPHCSYEQALALTEEKILRALLPAVREALIKPS